MRRALVFVDHTDAGCAALEAASRVASATLGQLTVVSIGEDEASTNPALAAAGARRLQRAAAGGDGSSLEAAEPGLPAIESISLNGRAEVAARGALDGARPDLAIIGSRRGGVDQRVLAACLDSAATAVLVARPGERRDDYTYRHVAIVGEASEAGIRVAKEIAGGDALLTVVGVVEPDAEPGHAAAIHSSTIRRAERHEAEAAIVDADLAAMASLLEGRGVEVAVIETSSATGDGSPSGLGWELISLGPVDVLVVRPEAAGASRGRRRRAALESTPRVSTGVGRPLTATARR